MNVHPDDGRLFYKLFSALLGYVNRKLNVVPEQFSKEIEYTSLPLRTRGEVRDALYAHREQIDQFVADNGFLMDIRNAPRDAQVIAFEKGQIPYIPADRDGTSDE